MLSRVGKKAPRPYRDVENYEDKAKKIGYRGGERDLFRRVELQIKETSEEVREAMLYNSIFDIVKAMADQTVTVKKNLF